MQDTLGQSGDEGSSSAVATLGIGIEIMIARFRAMLHRCITLLPTRPLLVFNTDPVQTMQCQSQGPLVIDTTRLREEGRGVTGRRGAMFQGGQRRLWMTAGG